MRWGSKFDDFVKHKAQVEFLEGTTLAGKTTVGLYKFMLMVAVSPKRAHILAGLDKGVIEKNLINKDFGIQEEFGNLIAYYGNGRGGESIPHILFMPNKDTEKIIYCLGYDDKKRWQKALGGQYGCLFIDEINVADIDFVREATMRCDYLLATLNPDDPTLPIYSEYINHSRPLDKWRDETPIEILRDLRQPKKDGWTHWFFGFKDNVSLTQEKIDTATKNVPKGTKLWKNKIMGLRGRATGLVFSNFSDKNIVANEFIHEQKEDGQITFKRLSIGVDTSYSQQSEDTIAIELCGVTMQGDLYVLEELTFNNAERHEPLAPSDVVKKIVDFADSCRDKWGDFRNIFIDSADQATIMEAKKYKRDNGSIYNFVPAWKDMRILDRINLQLGWIAKMQFYVADNCEEYIREVNVYSWKDDKDEPEDRNDHTINACQYAWLPYVADIGKDKETA